MRGRGDAKASSRLVLWYNGRMRHKILLAGICGAALCVGAGERGIFGLYGDTPDAKHAWAIHDFNRPYPKQVETPAGKPPSDAIVLFDGTQESVDRNWCAADGKPTKWRVKDGAFVCTPRSGMAYTFKKAQGMKIGKSLCEDDQIPYATEMLEAAKSKGVKFLLPVDNVIADKFPAEKDASDIQMKVCEGDIPDDWMGLDIGPKSVELFSEAVRSAKTVVWNGPMGCFEFAPLAKGTFGVCDAVATVKANGGISIIGGGDSVSAVKKSGKAAEMTHISTGGGASLEFLEGKVLPGVAALDDK